MLRNIFLKIAAFFRKTGNGSKAAPTKLVPLPIDAWRQCIGAVTEQKEFVSQLVGDRCYAAFLEKKTSASLVLLFPPSGKKLKYSVLYYSLDSSDSVALVNKLKRCLRPFRVCSVAVDRYGYSRNLMLAFFKNKHIIDVGMGFMSLSTATKNFLGMVLDNTIDHGGDKKLIKMAENVVFLCDSVGNLKPNKARPGDDIDGIVALIMAIAITPQTDE